MNFSVYGRPVNPSQVPFAEMALKALYEKGCKVFIHKQYLEFLLANGLTHSSKPEVYEAGKELPKKTDFLLSIGGDGTLLDTVLQVKNSGIPIVGFNAGRLGFLSGISTDNLSDAVDSLLKGHYRLDSRSLLRVDSNHPLYEGANTGLNDFTIHKQETASMITIHAYLNGEYLNSYWADGLIIATPTGSTGYSLSCGGPIIHPHAESFVITPIAPHNLNVRPIIVSDKTVVSLEVEGRGEKFMATLDSRSATIDSSFSLAIRKEDYEINLVRLNDENFLTTLRSKLNWGFDKRN